jgi:hypothetical protein
MYKIKEEAHRAMPTTYAHDLFGKKVYQKLPKEMKTVIREHGNLYRIGLHGPDILFFHNPVTLFGIKMHREKARTFFEQRMVLVRETGDQALLAYLLGFGCHYLLDSTCHPFVDEMKDKGVIAHSTLETEFDRALMIKTGKDPHHFYPAECIVPKKEYVQVIHKALPSVRICNISISLKMMRIVKKLMVCDDNGKRRAFLEKLAIIPGRRRVEPLIGHFMEKKQVPESRLAVEKLMKLFDRAVEEAPERLEELYRLSEEDVRLSARWNKTYNG